MKPLTEAMNSLEKTIQLQDNITTQTTQQTNQLIQSLTTKPRSNDIDISIDKIHSIVNEIIRDNHLGEVTKTKLESSLMKHTENILKEINSVNETTR